MHWEKPDVSTAAVLGFIKGRMYDYNAGRFLSVDPFIQDATSTQSQNPYSYIQNNPLAGTDPSGYNIVWVVYRVFSTARSAGKFIGRSAARFAEYLRQREAATPSNPNPPFKAPNIDSSPIITIPGDTTTDTPQPLGDPGDITDILINPEGFRQADPSPTSTAGSGDNGVSDQPTVFNQNESGDTADTESQSTKPIHEGKQGKHQPGHNNYDESKNKSILTHPDPQSLVDEHSGTGRQAGNTPVGEAGSKEIIDFGEDIGFHVDQSTGEKTPTTVGTVHHSKSDVHIVPALPREEEENQ